VLKAQIVFVVNIFDFITISAENYNHFKDKAGRYFESLLMGDGRFYIVMTSASHDLQEKDYKVL